LIFLPQSRFRAWLMKFNDANHVEVGCWKHLEKQWKPSIDLSPWHTSHADDQKESIPVHDSD
jgi:hypothetical protein